MRYAAATVAGLTSSADASSRTVGNRDAAETLPSRIADSMLAAIADDPAPRSISCVSSMMTMYYNKSLARIKTSASRLPRDVWVLQAGMLLSFLGLGLVFPFEIIYLHDVRGFTLPTAGLISATMAGTAIVGGIVAGPTIDRIGARATTLFALGALAAGWGGLAFITRPWEAAVCAMAAGIGNGCALPGTSTMILQMVPRAIRHRGAAISKVTVNIGIGVGGAIGGLIASTDAPITFTALLLVNAATYLVFAGFLLRIPEPNAAGEPQRRRGGYGRVLRIRPLLPLVLANVLFTCIGYGVLASLVPVFAHDSGGVDERVIGLLFTVNAGIVIFAQLPFARFVEGRRRLRALAAMSLIWAIGCLLVLIGALWLSGRDTTIALALAAAAFGVGECLQAVTLSPLVADLVPREMLGRAMALTGTAWWVGLAITPAVGGFLLASSPTATWLVAIGLGLGLAALMLVIEPSVPTAIRRTPRRVRDRVALVEVPDPNVEEIA